MFVGGWNGELFFADGYSTDCTTAWYIAYHGLVHRLPRPGTSFTTAWYIVYHVLVMKMVKPRNDGASRFTTPFLHGCW